MAEESEAEHWVNSKWRPAMGWMYMIVCTMDMVIFPIIWSIAQVLTKQPITQWDPLTLRGAGLFHMAMGAVLGIAAFGRTQEKVVGATIVTSPTPVTPPPVSPDPSPVSVASQTPDSSDPPPMSAKMAERMARFKK
ncbi:Holin of 3TMs, for gene-transfer release [uncultured Caudovirales phage]|uniref:Holin of 3TMs, for gene-transfer release n=1 Tax=uncultured Caudovirales phage TaxID=2100421 RepID=A0A6J7WSG6_9CAUD|nr:Holin of 3TMs, for gene-transfer release [uncultured Caudovirales phage]